MPRLAVSSQSRRTQEATAAVMTVAHISPASALSENIVASALSGDCAYQNASNTTTENQVRMLATANKGEYIKDLSITKM